MTISIGLTLERYWSRRKRIFVGGFGWSYCIVSVLQSVFILFAFHQEALPDDKPRLFHGIGTLGEPKTAPNNSINQIP